MKEKRVALALAAGLALTGCGKPLEDQVREAAFRDELIGDPTSVQLMDIYKTGEVICGKIKYKDHDDRWTIWYKFIVKEGELWVRKLSEDPMVAWYHNDLCKQKEG